MHNLNVLRQIPLDLVIERLGIPKHKEGYLRCPKPTHTNGDKKPSLKLYPETNSWCCYTCGEGGSVIDLVMVYQNLSCKEAIQYLIKEVS